MLEPSREDWAGELIRLLVENVRDYAVFVVDPDGIVRTWSPGAQLLLGYREDEVLGKSSDIFYLDQERAAGVPAQDRRQAAENCRGSDDRWHLRKDGSRFWSAGALTPLKNEDDALQGFAFIMRDRTDWWNRAEALQESEERHRVIADLTSDFALSGRVDDSGRLILEEATEGFAKVTGYTLEELEAIGGWPVLVYPKDIPVVEDSIQRILAGETADSEVRIMTREGQLRWLNYLGRAVRDSNSERWMRVHCAAQDVTERRLASETLFKEQERLRLALEASRMGTWEWEIKTGAVTWSPSLERIHGLEPGTFPGTFEAYQSDIHPEDREQVLATVARSVEQGRLYQLEYRLVRPDGSLRWVESRGKLLRDEFGQPARLVGVCLDITERKQFEERLAEQTQIAETLNRIGVRLTAELDLKKLVQLVTDEATQLTSARFGAFFYNVNNEQGESLTLYTISGLPRSAFEPLPMPRATSLFGLTYRGEGIVRLDDVTQDPRYGTNAPFQGIPEGHPPVRSYLAVPVVSRSSEVIGGLFFGHPEPGIFLESHEKLVAGIAAQAAVAIDNARLYQTLQEVNLHKQKLLESLQASEEQFRTMAESIPQLAWMAKSDGHIYWYNKRWYEYTRTTPAEMEGWGWQSVHDPVLLPEVLKRWKASITSGEPFDMAFPIRGADGQYRTFLTRVMPVRGEDGQIVHWFGTNTDISDRQRIEEELREAKEEAEAANQAKTQFLAVLSHELRTPLNPILLAASSMLERPPDPEEIKATLEMIRQNVNLQARLIDDLLDVMRIVRGKMPLHWEVADSHQLIEQAVSICRSEVYGHEQRLTKKLTARHHHVNADSARLQQVFWNLIKNAVKFTPEGGAIVIRTHNQKCEEENYLVVEVSDTGIGIEPEVLPQIFDPFQQGESTITRRFGGLGLGLAICKGIVEAHGGTLEAESLGKNRGATFRVVLKSLPDPATLENGDPTSGPRKKVVEQALPTSLKILVVEDEPSTLRLMARLLRNLGHSITPAGTITSAIEEIKANSFDLIVSDIGLPDGSGLELMRQVVDRRGSVPAIALTGYGMEEDIRRSREAGFTAHLTKPIDFAKLEAMIQKVAPTRPPIHSTDNSKNSNGLTGPPRPDSVAKSGDRPPDADSKESN